MARSGSTPAARMSVTISRALCATCSMSARLLRVVSMCRSAMMKKLSYRWCSRTRLAMLPT